MTWYVTIYDDMIWHDMTWHDIWYDDMIWHMIYDTIWWYDMIWYDVTWYDIWHDMIWYDTIWHDDMTYGTTWYDFTGYDIWYMTWYITRYDMIYDTIWYDMTWYTIWHDMIWYDMTRYDIHLLPMGFHSVAVVGKLVQKYKTDSYIQTVQYQYILIFPCKLPLYSHLASFNLNVSLHNSQFPSNPVTCVQTSSSPKRKRHLPLLALLAIPFNCHTPASTHAIPPISFFEHHSIHRYAPHNDVSVNDGPHTRRWSHNILILQYNNIIIIL
jgi:hypothetical protein